MGGSDTRVLVSNVGDTNTMARLAQMGLTTFSITPLMAETLFKEPLTIETAKELEAAARRNGAVDSKAAPKPPKPEAKTEPQTELEPEPEPQTKLETETEPETEPAPEPKAKPKAKAKAKAKGKAKG